MPPERKRRGTWLRHPSSTSGVADPTLDRFSLAVINYLSTGKPEYFTSAKKIILGTLYREHAWIQLPGVDSMPSHEGNKLFVTDWLNSKMEPYASRSPEQLQRAALTRTFCFWAHEAACDACNLAQKKRPVFIPYDDAVRPPKRPLCGSDWESYLSQNRDVLSRVLGKEAASDLEFLLINKSLLEKQEGEPGPSKTVATLLQEKYPGVELRTVERKIKTLTDVMTVHSEDALVREIHSELRRPLNRQEAGKPSRLPDSDDQAEAAIDW